MNNTTKKEILRPREICELLGIALSHLNNISQNDPHFPRKISISKRFTAYRKDAFYHWLDRKERGEI